jgi:hypothetical protein
MNQRNQSSEFGQGQTAKRLLVSAIGVSVIIMLICVGIVPANAAEDRPVISPEDLPDEINIVLASVVLKMRGLSETRNKAPVHFSDQSLRALNPPPFILEPFSMIGSIITNWGIRQSEPPSIALDALLSFADPLGRRATMSLGVDYTITSSAIEILDVTLLTVPPPDPEVRFFVIPTAQLPADFFSMEPRPEALHKLINENAFGTTRVPPPIHQSYYVLAYFVDRVRSDANVGLSATTADGRPFEASVRYPSISFEGWQIAINKAAFAFNRGEFLQFQALYQEGKDRPGGSLSPPRTVGVMSTYP